LKKSHEYEGKSSLSFKLADEAIADICWEKAVEAHKDFCLPQSDEGIGRSPSLKETSENPFSRSHMYDDDLKEGSRVSTVYKPSISSEESVPVIDHVEAQTSPMPKNGSAIPLPKTPDNLNETLTSLDTCFSSVLSEHSTRDSHAHKLLYGLDEKSHTEAERDHESVNGELVMSKIVKTDDQVIEMNTYKTLKDGLLQKRFEYKVVSTSVEVDPESALRKAVQKVTGLNGNYEAKKIEVKEENLPQLV